MINLRKKSFLVLSWHTCLSSVLTRTSRGEPWLTGVRTRTVRTGLSNSIKKKIPLNIDQEVTSQTTLYKFIKYFHHSPIDIYVNQSLLKQISLNKSFSNIQNNLLLITAIDKEITLISTKDIKQQMGHK